MNNNKITYHQQVSYCGKPRCRKCREGTGHGPYWYAYQTVDGRTTRTYIGKKLPPEAQAELDGQRESAPAQEREQSEAIIRIYTLGQFRLERRVGRNEEWQTVTEATWQHQRVRHLLACLISSPGRKLGREQIIETLWPEDEFETTSSRLDRAVYSLRQLFEPHRSRLANSQLLRTEREMVVLADHPLIWIDADAFERSLSEAHTTSDPGQKEELLSKGATLYSGHFLPDERNLKWTQTRRDSLQRTWVGAMLDLADHRAARESYLNAIEPLDRLLSVDPTNEAAVQRLISLLAQLGRRGEALRAYKHLAAMLKREYNIGPLPETRQLYEAVRRGVDKSQTATLPTPQSSEQAASTSAARQETQAVVQIGRVHQSPLVGRDQEITLLQNLITTTENTAKFKLAVQKRMFAAALDPQRRPQSVLILGEVGIGKTRLAEEASREAKRRNWAVAWSRVYAQEGSIPYRLWTEVLRMATNQGVWQRQELTARPLVFQPLNALLPELKVPPVSFAAALSPEQEQLRLWEAVYELLSIISTSTPLLIALDDLQWADGSSCELLAYLARRLHGHPIIIVGTCRDNELPKDHPLRSLLPDLQRENVLESVPLQPLSNEQIDKIVTNVPNIPLPLAQNIRTRAAGNPFFAEELARVFGPQPDLSGLPETGDDKPLVLPDTITAVLDLRLARLSQLCQQLLRKAAVLGGSFEFQLINAMEASTPNTSEDLVLELLEEGLKSGMLTEVGTGTRITYYFWHPLLASHLYEGLSAARRASLHRRAANLLIQRHQGREAEGAATITYHLVHGGAEPQQIVHYAELAGDRAYGLSSYPEAEQHYRTALEYLGTPTPILTSSGQLTPDQLRKAELLELVGECRRVGGEYEDARRYYEDALKLREMQQLTKSSPDYEQEIQIIALLWCEIGVTWGDTVKHISARECYSHAEEVLKEAGIEDGSAWAYLKYQQSYVIWREGNYDDARETAKEASELFEKALAKQNNSAKFVASRLTRTRRIFVGDPVSLGRMHVLLSNIEAAGGRCGDALPHLKEALAICEQYDYRREIAIICCNLGDLYLRTAEYSQAQSALRRSLSLAEDVGERLLISFVVGNLGILYARLGNLTDAEAEIRKAITLAERGEDLMSLCMFNSYLAATLQDQGKFLDACSVLLHSLTTVRKTHVAPYIGLALVVLGSMRVTQAFAALEDDKQPDYNKYLARARRTLTHALTFEDMEAETKIEGQLALALVQSLLEDNQTAFELASKAQEEARQYELRWLIIRSSRILGCIMAAQGECAKATAHFEQAIKESRRKGLRLEQARALQQYGEMLLQQEDVDAQQRQRGIACLTEARELFTACEAALDLRMVERTLARHEVISGV